MFPESAEDVAAGVRLAVEQGLRVAPQGSGHARYDPNGLFLANHPVSLGP